MTAAPAEWSPASVVVHVHGDDAVVHAIGEFDLATLSVLKDALHRVLARTGGVRLDLSQVSFIDAASLGVVVDARRTLAAEGRSLRLAHPSPTVAKLLAITDLAALAR